MAVTTQQQEFTKLRSYLNPAIRGVNTNSILNALAVISEYVVNNSASITDQKLIARASGVYLDLLLANYGIIRPPDVGVSDSIFRQVGIQVKNRKQVRDLINQLLNIIFGDGMTKASSQSSTIEPYALADGDTLIVNFDEAYTVTVTFNTEDFINIAQASAHEVANKIVETLSSQGFTGVAFSNNSGNGNYVELISSTIGPASSVTVLGGSAQNQLLFPSVVQSAGGNDTTQWTISLVAGGLVRFTWSAGANPFIGELSQGDYVNIYGGGFTGTGYEGTYTIVSAVGGAVNSSYFEVSNILAPSPVSNPITQGGTTQDPAILFFMPVRSVIAMLSAYAAQYQVMGGDLQIFLPASTQTVFRTRLGSAHLHNPPNVVFTFMANPNYGDQFIITPTVDLVAGIDFAIEPNYVDTMKNIAAAINDISGLAAVVGINPVVSWIANGSPNYGYTKVITYENILTVYQDSTLQSLSGAYTFTLTAGSADPGAIYTNNGYNFTVEEYISAFTPITTVLVPTALINIPGLFVVVPNTFPEVESTQALLITSGVLNDPPMMSGILTKVSGTGTSTIEYSAFEFTSSYFGSANITVSSLNGDPLSIEPNQYGPYMYDLTQTFSVTAIDTTLTQNLSGINTNVQYIFTVSSANATAGAIYSNNGADFIVTETISAGTTLVANNISGSLISSVGTLTKLSGTGDATITFTSYSTVAINSGVFQVVNSSQFPNSAGFLMFEYGTGNQEGPVPYIATPSGTTILISPTYTLQKVHLAGSSVSLVTRGAVSLTQTGSDWPFYITDVSSGRVYAQDLIESVVASGINVNYDILYPGDVGLGKWGTPYSDIVEIWAEEQ